MFAQAIFSTLSRGMDILFVSTIRASCRSGATRSVLGRSATSSSLLAHAACRPTPARPGRYREDRPIISAAAPCSRQAARVELTAANSRYEPPPADLYLSERQTVRECFLGLVGADGTSRTLTGRLAGGPMADGRSPQETRPG
jgi:hypothetical protein